MDSTVASMAGLFKSAQSAGRALSASLLTAAITAEHQRGSCQSLFCGIKTLSAGVLWIRTFQLNDHTVYFKLSCSSGTAGVNSGLCMEVTQIHRHLGLPILLCCILFSCQKPPDRS